MRSAFPLVVLLWWVATPPVRAQDTAHVVVVATTDVHGHALAWDYVRDTIAPWGLTRAATIVDSLRRRYPGQVLVVDAGDLLQGSPFATFFATQRAAHVHPIIDAMNATGYDVVTPGNHDFNFGLAALAEAYRSAAFPIVSGNIYRLPRDTLAYAPYVVLPRGGIRVGVTGFTTPGVMIWDRERVRGRVVVRPILPEALRVLPAVRAESDLTVVAMHSGMSAPASYDTTGVGDENVAAWLAALPERPDLVIVGHSHRAMRDSVIAGVHFLQPRPWARSVAVAHVWLVDDGAGYRVARVVGEAVPLAGVPPLPPVERRLAEAHVEVRNWVTLPLGTAAGEWSARYARAEDTPLIDFVNEVQRRVAGADLSATASFTVAGGLGPGAIRIRDVAGIYPYENTLKAVRIDGVGLRAYLERSAEYYRGAAPSGPVLNDSIPGYHYDIVRGVSYTVDLARPVGARIRDLTYRGRAVTPEDTFTLALNDYRQGGGGGFDMLAGLPVVYDVGESVRGLLIDAIRSEGTLRPEAFFEDSWRIVPRSARLRVRAAFAPETAAPHDSILLRVLAINDLHGALVPSVPQWADGRRVGGAAALTGWMDSLAAECGCVTLRLDGGDQFQGTPISNFVYGRSVVEVLNLMGLDAAAIGNHEFDWTIDTLRARMGESNYFWLAANIREASDGSVPEWVLPWAMLERNGVWIAVIGTITESTPTTTMPTNVTPLRFPDAAASVRAVLPAVRAQRPDFTIVVTHSGAFCDSTCRGEVVELARGLDSADIDLIVSGHTHSEVHHVVHGIPVVQARSSGSHLGVVDFVRRADGRRDVVLRVETAWTDAVRPDSAVAAVVARYAEVTDRVAARPVARLKFALPRDRQAGEFPLGRLLADGFRTLARSDVGLINNGGIRADLPAGDVTYGDLFAVQPFGNMVVTLTVTGAVLRGALEHALARGRPDAHVAGITVRYDPGRPAGERVREIRRDDGRRVRDGDSVTVAVPDFLAVGGAGFTMFRDRPLVRTDMTDLDALLQYVARLPQPIDVSEHPRFVTR